MLSQGEIASEITVIDETLSAASMHNKVAFTKEELKFLQAAVQEYMKRGYFHQSDGKTVLNKLNAVLIRA
jgi:tRNA C32,U32 (ribose-2'-O)-methylase TrmJ